jgi:sugar lactone lactonase YvrE
MLRACSWSVLLALCVSCAAQEGEPPTTPSTEKRDAAGTTKLDAAPATIPVPPSGEVPPDFVWPDGGSAPDAATVKLDGGGTPGPDGGGTVVVGGMFPLPALPPAPALDPGKAPTGDHQAEEVPGSPSFEGTGMVWWGDRLIIADRGKKKLFQLVPPSTFSELPALDLQDPTGVALDGQGNLVVADCGPCLGDKTRPSRMIRVSRAGKREVILEPAVPTQDIVVHKSGMMYWGGFDHGQVRAGMPGGQVITLNPSVGHSYGTAISPMQNWLYASSKIPDGRKLFRFPLDANGMPGAGELVIQFDKATAVGTSLGRLQGITVDALGHVYAVGSEGQQNPAVVIIAPDTKKVIGMVYKIPTNRNDVAFGDADLRTLYITGGGRLYRAKLPVTGLAQ